MQSNETKKEEIPETPVFVSPKGRENLVTIIAALFALTLMALLVVPMIYVGVF